MSIPAAQTADGIPIGVQIGAAAGREQTLFALAAQIEKSRPWPLLNH
jgi:amidase